MYTEIYGYKFYYFWQNCQNKGSPRLIWKIVANNYWLFSRLLWLQLVYKSLSTFWHGLTICSVDPVCRVDESLPQLTGVPVMDCCQGQSGCRCRARGGKSREAEQEKRGKCKLSPSFIFKSLKPSLIVHIWMYLIYNALTRSSWPSLHPSICL